VSSEQRRALALIVAYAHGRVIGRDGGMPWHFREDLQHFKRVTNGHAVIMGRKTHASIGRPLPGRRNLVVTRQRDYEAPGCDVFHDLDAAVEAARAQDDCPFVIGGATLYAATLPQATHLYVTEIDLAVDGDTWFPELDATEWVEIECRDGDDARLTFRVFRRSPAE
jgi:dihydrofolate reductase